MSSQIKIYRKKWHSLTVKDRRSMTIRLLASALSFVIGCGIIFNMRAQLIGEDGSSMAMYFLGSLFILTTNLMIFGSKLHNPEAWALKLCIAAVVFTGAWVNIEEKVLMPLLASDCDDNCVIVYERTVPFSDEITIYREGWGWRMLD